MKFVTRAAAALGVVVLLAPVFAPASTLTTIYSPTGTGDGAGPRAGLTLVGGKPYGITPYGGATGNGAIFSVDATSGAETVLYSFPGGSEGSTPLASMLDVGGVLYGTASVGGGTQNGTVFKFDIATGLATTLHRFAGADGSTPAAPLIKVGALLYGTTLYGGSAGNGTVFSVDPATGTEAVLHSFTAGADGSQPYGGLVQVGGRLYGVTQFGGAGHEGTLFTIDPKSGAETVVHSFAGGSDGAVPEAAMIDVKGTLYGTTASGGASGAGTVFKFVVASETETVLYAFSGGADGGQPLAGLLDAGGVIYGATETGGRNNTGAVFKVDATAGTETVLYSFAAGLDGSFPQSALTSAAGKLLGTTEFGGTRTQGTVFSVSITDGTESILHSFTATTPEEGVMLANLSGALAINTTDGGTSGFGSLLKVDTGTGAETPLLSFDGSAGGGFPVGAMLPLGGALYGTTAGGGTGCNGFGCGTIFKVDATTGVETLLHAFGSGSAPDGTSPYGSLISVGGNLYGTTLSGGNGCSGNGCGTVFMVNPKVGKEVLLHSFTGGSDGAAPFAGLVDFGGVLYGTTVGGGASSVGTIFKINPKTGVESVVHSFNDTPDGAFPYAPLISMGGFLYGTTSYGGSGYGGTVFKLNPKTGVETVLYNFSFGAGDGGSPLSGLTALSGHLYGTTAYGGAVGDGCGGSSCGTLYTVDPASGTEQVLHVFQGGLDGGNPNAALIFSGGAFYGTTGSGGAGGYGTVFRLTP